MVSTKISKAPSALRKQPFLGDARAKKDLFSYFENFCRRCRFFGVFRPREAAKSALKMSGAKKFLTNPPPPLKEIPGTATEPELVEKKTSVI